MNDVWDKRSNSLPDQKSVEIQVDLFETVSLPSSSASQGRVCDCELEHIIITDKPKKNWWDCKCCVFCSACLAMVFIFVSGASLGVFCGPELGKIKETNYYYVQGKCEIVNIIWNGTNSCYFGEDDHDDVVNMCDKDCSSSQCVYIKVVFSLEEDGNRSSSVGWLYQSNHDVHVSAGCKCP